MGLNLFSFKGRISRRTFWKTAVSAMAVAWIIGAVLIGIYLTGDRGQRLAIDGLFLFWIPFGWVLLAVQAKRWHDIEFSGWIALLSLVPYLNILYGLIALILLGFVEGTPGTNKYGTEPV